MKNAIIIVVILLLVLLVYLYVRAKFIWSKISFGVEIKGVDFGDIKQVEAKISLLIRNGSDFNVKLKNTRITVRGKDGKVIAYSDKIDMLEILAYATMSVPLEVKINTVEILNLISKPYLKYKIKSYYKIIPLSYSEVIQKL